MIGLVGSLALAIAGGGTPQTAAAPQPSEAAPAPAHAVIVYEWAAATAECDVAWTTLGGVAGVASNHTVLRPEQPQALSDRGQPDPSILGPTLDGRPGRALVPDTDGGRLDADDALDRAVGPFQFLPTTWEIYGTDANGDGSGDPQNLWDAAAAAAAMLCDKGVEDDIDRAYTAYFGTEEWNPWAHRRRLELVEWDETRPQPDRSEAETIELRPAPTETTLDGLAAARRPGVDDRDERPVRLGELMIEGDWNGDGSTDAGALTLDPGSARFELTDHEGRPYGAPIAVEPHLDGPLGQDVSLLATAGDWNGDGLDTPGLVVVADDRATRLLFDERGDVADTTPLGPSDPVADSFVVTTVAATTTGPEPTFWRTITTHNGTEVRLFRVGEIAVAESVAPAVSELLAAAAADGITLEGWGWRSHQQQIDLRQQNCPDVWTTRPSQCSPPTAIPGTSQHEFGLAIDFHVDRVTIGADSPEFRWLRDHAEEYGLFNLPSEPWHWSTTGG